MHRKPRWSWETYLEQLLEIHTLQSLQYLGQLWQAHEDGGNKPCQAMHGYHVPLLTLFAACLTHTYCDSSLEGIEEWMSFNLMTTQKSSAFKLAHQCLLEKPKKGTKKEKRERLKKISCSEIQDYHFYTNWYRFQPPFVESVGPLCHQQFMPTEQFFLVPLLAIDFF